MFLISESVTLTRWPATDRNQRAPSGSSEGCALARHHADCVCSSDERGRPFDPAYSLRTMPSLSALPARAERNCVRG